MKFNTLRTSPFSLVLSGGGALGIAHLGILSDLEKSHILPSEIIGTSMGGIIGACLAVGLKEREIDTLIQSFAGISNWMRFSFSGNAIIHNKKIEKIFETIFQDKKMADTLIPLKIITTHLSSGEKRVFEAKDDVYIKDAILATMAIPGIFSEHIIEDEIYVDGFICENLGVSEASFETILAVDVLGKNAFEEKMPDSFFKTSNVLEMFEKSLRLIIFNQSKMLLAQSNKNIILIEPQTKAYKTFHFHKHQEIRNMGLGLLS